MQIAHTFGFNDEIRQIEKYIHSTIAQHTIYHNWKLMTAMYVLFKQSVDL